MPRSNKVLTWIEPRGVVVGAGAASYRASADQPFSSAGDARQWVDGEAAANADVAMNYMCRRQTKGRPRRDGLGCGALSFPTRSLAAS